MWKQILEFLNFNSHSKFGRGSDSQVNSFEVIFEIDETKYGEAKWGKQVWPCSEWDWKEWERYHRELIIIPIISNWRSNCDEQKCVESAIKGSHWD